MRKPSSLTKKPRITHVAVTAVLMVLLYISPAAAQPDAGLCGLPGGTALLGLFGLLIQGVLVVGGIYLLAQGVGSMFGAGRGSGGRQNLLYGILIVMFGLLLPEFVGFLAEQTGTSLQDAGLGCLFG